MQATVANVTPYQFNPQQPRSDTQSVLKRELRQILPLNSSVDYSFSGTNSIKFQISSTHSYLDGLNSFLRFELRTIGTTNGSTNDTNRCLNSGGVHALFDRVYVRSGGSSTELERCDDYARWYMVNSYAKHSKDVIEYSEFQSGDALCCSPIIDQCEEKLSGSIAVDIDSPDAISIAGTSTAFDDELQVGDVVVARSATGAFLHEARVTAIGSATAIDVTPAFPADAAAGSLLFKKSYESARKAVCKTSNTSLDSTGITVSMKPLLAILGLNHYIPLPFIQGGLEFEFILNNPVYAMKNGPGGNTSKTLDYRIVNPRFMADLVQPSEAIKMKHAAAYNQDAIKFPMEIYRHFAFTDTGAAGSSNFVAQPNLRSVNSILTVRQNARANNVVNATDATDAYEYDGTGTFIKAGTTSYQFRIGSELYPPRRIDLDAFNAEAHANLQRTFGTHGSVLFHPRYSIRDWTDVNVDSGVQDQPTALIMSYKVQRGNMPFSGQDASVNPLSVDFEEGAYSPGTRYTHVYVTGSQLLQIGRSGVVVRN